MTRTTPEPRKVDQPFMRRWLGSSLELIRRSPGRFGLLIALLDSLDSFAVNLRVIITLKKCGLIRWERSHSPSF